MKERKNFCIPMLSSSVSPSPPVLLISYFSLIRVSILLLCPSFSIFFSLFVFLSNHFHDLHFFPQKLTSLFPFSRLVHLPSFFPSLSHSFFFFLVTLLYNIYLFCFLSIFCLGGRRGGSYFADLLLEKFFFFNYWLS